MSFLGVKPFESVENDLKPWENLDDAEKDLYLQALALVQGEPCDAAMARIRAIFAENTNLNVNKTLVPCYGETLLHQAVQEQKVEYVKVLLELGADPCMKNAMDGETPLELLQILNREEYEDCNEVQKEILKLLLQAKGADYKQSAPKSHDEQMKEIGQEIWDSNKEKFWAINVDPALVERLQERLKENSSEFMASMLLQDISRNLQDAMANND